MTNTAAPTTEDSTAGPTPAAGLTVANSLTGHDNAFGFLRLCLAMLVRSL
jgi:hypothetical protein